MLFSQLEMAPADPILGLNDAFKKDPRPNKVNLGVGVYTNEDGVTPVLASVKDAEAKLLQTETTKSYLGIDGLDSYNKATQELLFGPDSHIIKEHLAMTVQTPGGTGGLRVAADFLKAYTKSSTIWISSPTWANHVNVFATAGFKIEQYRYYDANNYNANFAWMLEDLKKAKAGDLVLLHGCCHNPTGIDLTEEQFKEVGLLCKNLGLTPFIDFAYQGFGIGLDEDAIGIRELVKIVPEMVIASSFSKNFGLYNERVGAMTVVTQSQELTERALSQVKRLIRANYSNPSAHGGKVVAMILTTPELRKMWEDEVKVMRERIASMRKLFVDTLKASGVKQDFSFIERQAGMFSFSGLTPEQVAKLRTDFGVYIVGSGRISVAGMNKKNIPIICNAIAQVV